MKLSILILGSVLTLAALTTGAYMLYQQHKNSSSTYASYLSTIAKEINSKNLSWTAHESASYYNNNMEHFQMLNQLQITKPPKEFSEVEFTEEQLKAAPSSFDSRTQWPNCPSISLIRDQSSCGSCWAFGAAEAMSDRICIGSNGAKQTLVSADDLTGCCKLCGNGCNGGQLYPAWLFWRYTGIVDGGLYGDKTTCKPYSFPPCSHHVPPSAKYPACPSADYPTPQCTKTCANGEGYATSKSFASKVYTVTGAAAISTEISTNGPIEAAFTVYEDFVTYKSGVYTHTTGKELGGHAIRILGYGTLNGVDYWLVANSWNEQWGDNGYFKIARGKNECGIENSGVAGIAA